MVAKLLRTIARLMRNFITNIVKIPGICKNLPKNVQMNPETDISCGRGHRKEGAGSGFRKKTSSFSPFSSNCFFVKEKICTFAHP